MIEVRALRPADEPSWEAFLRGRPDALLYHSLAYRDLLLVHLGCRAEYLLALEGGEVGGVLPLMWTPPGSARVANSLPYFGSHGSAVASTPAARDALLAAWDERATDPGTAAATLVANPFGAEPAREPAFDLVDERLNQATPLPGGIRRAEPSAGRNLRKAERLGVVAGRDAGALGALAEIHRENMARVGGVAKDESFFAAIPRHFDAGEGFDVYTARLDGALAAGLLVFWAGATAEYHTPAIAREHRAAQPLAAVLARALADAAARGFAWFNWGGTWLSNDGLRRFKRKWGAREVRYRYYTKVNDRGLLEATPAELRERFGHFYVLPFSALQPEGAAR